MKPLLLLGCSLLLATAAHTQFSLLPYAGFEQSRNTVRYSNAFSASEINGNLKAGLKLQLRQRGGFTPFLNLTTNPAPVRLAFDNAGSLVSTVRKSNPQLRLEGGYQYNSRPVFFGKKSPASSGSSFFTPATNNIERKSCGSMSNNSRCGARKARLKTAPVNNTFNMRLQPSLALAYIPAATKGVEQTSSGFEYTAGSWKTALVPSMGFEFAKGATRLFTLGVFYTRPLAQKDERVTTFREGKSYVTSLQPTVSTWGLTVGVPIGFGRSAKTKAVKSATEKRSCTKTYYRHCLRMN